MSDVPQPLRILVLTSTYPRYQGDATPAFVKDLCVALAEEGCQCIVLAPHAQGLKSTELIEGVFCQRFRYAPQKLEQLAYGGGVLANLREKPLRWFLFPFYLSALLVYAIYFILKNDIRVIHAHWVVPQGLIAIFIRGILFWRPIKVVMTAHGADLNTNMGRVLGAIRQFTIRQADRVAVVSAFMQERAIALGALPAKTVIAPMGVDTQKFNIREPYLQQHELLFVGRLVPKKGVSHLFDAFALLKQKKPDAKLTIIGDGPLRQALEEQVASLNLAESVVFAGVQSSAKVAEAFQSAGVFVMPSVVDESGDQEGLGLVAAEAMACGCPVVAFDLPAVRDLVLHEVTGLLVQPKDNSALASATLRILHDAETRKKITSAAYRHVQNNFSWQASAARYSAIYKSLY